MEVPRSEELQTDKPETLILAVIQNAKVARNRDAAGALAYKKSQDGLGALETVDLATIQCSIGRFADRQHWVLVDRSGPYAQPTFHEEP